MKQTLIMSTMAAALIFAAGTVPAQAGCVNHGGKSVEAPAGANGQSAADINKEIVAEATESSETNGEKHAGGEPAKPIENWFGCKPGNTKCLSQKGREQEAAAPDADPETPEKPQPGDVTASADPAVKCRDTAKPAEG